MYNVHKFDDDIFLKPPKGICDPLSENWLFLAHPSNFIASPLTKEWTSKVSAFYDE